MAAPIGQMNIVLSANAATFSEAISQAQRQLDALANKSKAAGHSTVSSVQAASAALRELNGDFTNNIRAVERFITTIPGVGSALKAAFPLVGGVAFAALLAEMGKKIYEFQKQMTELPTKIQDGFRQMNLSTQMAADNLRLVNDRLQNEINKLEGKPQNNLAIALDEARIKADDLYKSAFQAMEKTKELLAANKISQFTGFFRQQDATTDVAATVNKYRSSIAGRAFELDDATRRGDKGGIDKGTRDLAAVRKEYADYLDGEIKKRTGTVTSDIVGVGPMAYGKLKGDQTANLNILRGERGAMYAEDDLATQQQRNADEVPKLEGLRAGKGAQSEQLRKFEEERDKQIQNGAMNESKRGLLSAEADRNFWSARINAFKAGSSEYQTIEKKIAADDVKMYEEHKAATSSQRKLAVDTFYMQPGNEVNAAVAKLNDQLRIQAEAVSRTGPEWEAFNREASRTREIVQAANSAMQEWKLSQDVATGAISKHGAAMQIAALHAADYAGKIAILQAELQQLAQDQKNLDPNAADYQSRNREIQTRGARVGNEVLQTQNQAALTAAQDKLNEFNTTGLGGAIKALQEFAAEGNDLSRAFHELTSGALKGFNELLTTGISTRHFHWNRELSNYGAGLARSGAGVALNRAEGAVFGGVFGKLGTKGNPMIVAFEGIGGDLSSMGKTMFSGFKMPNVAAIANAGDSASKGSGFWGGLTKIFSSFVGGFADGGNVSAGSMAWVGERGPELAVFGSDAHIIPNGPSMAMGGGDTHIGYIDARGATSPAQVAAQVREAARAGAQMGRSMAASDRKDEQRRKIGTGR